MRVSSFKSEMEWIILDYMSEELYSLGNRTQVQKLAIQTNWLPSEVNPLIYVNALYISQEDLNHLQNFAI